MDDMKCKDCKWYNTDEITNEGMCRKYAPKPTSMGDSMTLWPSVLEKDWCGEFETKVNENGIPPEFAK